MEDTYSPLYLQSHRNQVKSVLTGKMEILHPLLKRVERRMLELVTHQPHLTLPGNHGTDPSRSYVEAHGGQRGDAGQPAQVHQRQGQPSGLL